MALLGGTLAGVHHFIPEIPPTVPPVIVAAEAPEPKITVLHTLPEFASVLIDLPIADTETQILKTEVNAGVLTIHYGGTEKHIPIFPDVECVILHSTFSENRVILEVSKL